MLNAGAALFIAGKVKDIKEGIERAEDAINTGKALKIFREFLSFSRKKENA